MTADTDRFTIFLVEDEYEQAKNELEDILGAGNFRLDWRGTFESAYLYIEKAEKKPHMVLLDIQLLYGNQHNRVSEDPYYRRKLEEHETQRIAKFLRTLNPDIDSDNQNQIFRQGGVYLFAKMYRQHWNDVPTIIYSAHLQSNIDYAILGELCGIRFCGKSIFADIRSRGESDSFGRYYAHELLPFYRNVIDKHKNGNSVQFTFSLDSNNPDNHTKSVSIDFNQIPTDETSFKLVLSSLEGLAADGIDLNKNHYLIHPKLEDNKIILKKRETETDDASTGYDIIVNEIEKRDGVIDRTIQNNGIATDALNEKILELQSKLSKADELLPIEQTPLFDECKSLLEEKVGRWAFSTLFPTYAVRLKKLILHQNVAEIKKLLKSVLTHCHVNISYLASWCFNLFAVRQATHAPNCLKLNDPSQKYTGKRDPCVPKDAFIQIEKFLNCFDALPGALKERFTRDFQQELRSLLPFNYSTLKKFRDLHLQYNSHNSGDREDERSVCNDLTSIFQFSDDMKTTQNIQIYLPFPALFEKELKSLKDKVINIQKNKLEYRHDINFCFEHYHPSFESSGYKILRNLFVICHDGYSFPSLDKMMSCDIGNIFNNREFRYVGELFIASACDVSDIVHYTNLDGPKVITQQAFEEDFLNNNSFRNWGNLVKCDNGKAVKFIFMITSCEH